MTQMIPRTSVPSGGVPYHPKEFGAEGNIAVYKKTGLIGVFYLIAAVWTSVAVCLIASPFVLLGLAEVVTTSPTSWRVRWIRDN